MPARGKKTGKADGKRFPLNMRTTEKIRTALERAANKSGRSLAAEVEFRLEQSFRKSEAAAMLSEIRTVLGQHTTLLGRSVIELNKIATPKVAVEIFRYDNLDDFAIQTQINGDSKDIPLSSLLSDFLSQATSPEEIEKLSGYLTFMASQVPQLYAGLQATRRI